MRKDGKKGFVDSKGRVVVPIEYGFVTTYYGGLAAVGFGNDAYSRCGFVDRNGEITIPIKYVSIGDEEKDYTVQQLCRSNGATDC